MTQNSSNSSTESCPGNTTTGQDFCAFRWCFTLNNYTENEYNDILKYSSNSSKIYIIGKEIGENNTPHLQGYINLKTKSRLTALKKLNKRIHWEKVKGSEEQNLAYCSKDGNFITNAALEQPLKIINNLWEWQYEMEQILLKEPNDRIVNWISDDIGCTGKTQFLKYMVHKHKCIFTNGGKRNDIMNLLYNQRKYLKSANPAIIIWNLPRDINQDFISYEAIENIKDGLICNNKFECGSFIMNSPNILIMSNQYPTFNKLTKDRWNIYNINNKMLFKRSLPIEDTT